MLQGGGGAVTLAGAIYILLRTNDVNGEKEEEAGSGSELLLSEAMRRERESAVFKFRLICGYGWVVVHVESQGKTVARI